VGDSMFDSISIWKTKLAVGVECHRVKHRFDHNDHISISVIMTSQTPISLRNLNVINQNTNERISCWP